MPRRKNALPMSNDARVIAELGRKVVFLECRNQELEEKVKNMEELLDQVLNAKKVESDEEPLMEAVFQTWPTSQKETGAESRSPPVGVLQNNADLLGTTTSAIVADQAVANTSSIPAVTARISSAAVSAASTFLAFPSTRGLTGPSTSHSTDHVNVNLPSSSGTSRSNRSKALYNAVQSGDAEKVEKILREGANVNFTEKSSREAPLHAAASKGNAEIITLLVEFGACANVFDDEGYTPLHLTASGGYRHCIEKLVEAGACIDIRDLNGNTALHLAADIGFFGCVSALLHAGADRNLKNKLGQIPFDLAYNYLVKNLF